MLHHVSIVEAVCWVYQAYITIFSAGVDFSDVLRKKA